VGDKSALEFASRTSYKESGRTDGRAGGYDTKRRTLTARTRSQFKFGFAALSPRIHPSIYLPRAAAATFVAPTKIAAEKRFSARDSPRRPGANAARTRTSQCHN